MTRFETEWNGCKVRLRGFASSLTLNTDDAEDLFADARLKALMAYENKRPDTEFENWACQILMNTFRDDMRKRNVRNTMPYAEIDTSGFDLTYEYDPSGVLDIMRVVESQTPQNKSRAIDLIMGYTSAEIAKRDDIPQWESKQNRTAIKKRLKISLDK